MKPTVNWTVYTQEQTDQTCYENIDGTWRRMYMTNTAGQYYENTNQIYCREMTYTDCLLDVLSGQFLKQPIINNADFSIYGWTIPAYTGLLFPISFSEKYHKYRNSSDVEVNQLYFEHQVRILVNPQGHTLLKQNVGTMQRPEVGKPQQPIYQQSLTDQSDNHVLSTWLTFLPQCLYYNKKYNNPASVEPQYEAGKIFNFEQYSEPVPLTMSGTIAEQLGQSTPHHIDFLEFDIYKTGNFSDYLTRTV